MYHVKNVSITQTDYRRFSLDLVHDGIHFNIDVERISGLPWNHDKRRSMGITSGCVTGLMIYEIRPINDDTLCHKSICRGYYGWSIERGYHWIVPCDNRVKHIYDWVLKLFD